MNSSIAKRKYLFLIALLIIIVSWLAFPFTTSIKPEKYTYIKSQPDYEKVHLTILKDSISIPVDSLSLPNLTTFGFLETANTRYVSFFNNYTLTYDICNLDNNKYIKPVKFIQHLPAGIDVRKIKCYFKNFDSIYIAYLLTIYRIDTSGALIEKMTLSQKPFTTLPDFSNYNPVILRNKNVLIDGNAYLSSKNFGDLSKRPALLNIDFKENKTSLLYSYPPLYHQNIYGTLFLSKYYCMNNSNSILFSFPADPNLYQTTLDNSSIVYNGQSKFLSKAIKPVAKDDLNTGEDLNKTFLFRDSYGPIYYDKYTNRYLRVCEQKISNEDWVMKKFSKRKSLLVFDGKFTIIGETLLPANIDPYVLFITSNGILIKAANSKNQAALNFVRIAYSDLNI
jgi:hypothetical protein